MPIVADAAIALRADLSKYRGDLKGAERETQAAGGRFQRALSPQNIGRALTAGGAAAGAAFTKSVELASNFEDQLRTINTVAKLSDSDLAALGDNIQQLARDSGKGTDDLTAAYYDLVSAGIPAENAMAVLKDSATLATGALSTTGESVDLVTSTLNAYGMEASESARLTDIFAKTVQDGKVTAAELASSIAQVAPIAANAGISIEEVAAGYANLTAKGVPAAQASTQMRAAISSLLTPNETLNKLQQQTGINFADLAREKGLGVALEAIRVATAANGDAFAELAGVTAKDLPAAFEAAQDKLGLTNTQLEKLSAVAGKDGAAAAMAELQKMVGAGDSAYAKSLGSVEALSFAVNTTGDAFTDSQAGIEGFNEGIDGLATEQAAEKMRSPAEAAARLTQNVLTFMQDVGGPFASSLGPMLLTLNSLGPALGGLIKPAQLAGGVIGGLAGKLVAGAVGLIPAVGPAFAAAGSAIGGVVTTAAGIVIAAWPLILAALIIGALVLLFTNPELRAKAFEIGGAILKGIGDALGAIVGFLAEIGGKVIGAVAGFVGNVIGLILSIPGRVLGLAGALLGLWVRAWAAIIGAVAGGVGRVVGFILGIPGRVAAFVGRLIGLGGQAAGGVASAIGDGAGKVVGFILGIPGRVLGFIAALIGVGARAIAGVVAAIVGGVGKVVGFILGIPARVGGLVAGMAGLAGQVVSAFLGIIGQIPGAMAGIIGGAVGAAKDAIGSVLGFAGDVAGNVGGFLGGLVPQFQTGTVNVPADMLAFIHGGEMIIPEPEAEQIRRGQLGLGGGAAGGGDTIIVQLLDKMTVRTPRDIHDGLRQLKQTGRLRRRPASA